MSTQPQLPACALVLITHPGIGSALLHQAQRIFAGEAPQELNGQLTGLYLLEVDDDLTGQQLDAQFQRCAAAFKQDTRILMMTDLEGATPASLALRHAHLHHWPLISGLSLPMLLKAITYRHYPLDELIRITTTGACNAVRVLQPAIPGI